MSNTDPSLTVFSKPEETALDGVCYASLWQNGVPWRLGSLSPIWREELAAIGSQPDSSALESLATRGVFLSRSVVPPPLAIMCCGLGSIWPGMGRELYDNFPVARSAMDRIAAIAEWDILSLMDETDLEKISHIRWQIPYLFMVEYAQWCQLAALGLQPALFCGHSLGELVALCLSGVYSYRAAWYLLDTRAEHIAALEKNSTNAGGMLAVPADAAVIDDTLQKWPSLFISNVNTPRQYILSGPRDALLEARKALRAQRIPAMMLNIGVAFHNPAMRILRDISFRRLCGLGMRAAPVPMFSCVHVQPYPASQDEISRYIADLDENTVEWPKSVDSMRDIHGIRIFLELGPRETLCGIVNDLDPSLECLSAARKGNETLAMRQLCARLFAAGYLNGSAINRQKASRANQPPRPDRQPAKTLPPHGFTDLDPDEVKIILQLIAKASNREPGELAFDQDLRHDLALRSSGFPFLVQEAERLLERQIVLENLTQIATVGDLVRFFLGGLEKQPTKKESAPETLPTSDRLRPLLRLSLDDRGSYRPALINPAERQVPAVRDDSLILCIFDPELPPEIWFSLAVSCAAVAVPRGLAAHFSQVLLGSGCTICELDCGPQPESETLARALAAASLPHAASGLFLVAPALDETTHDESTTGLGGCLAACTEFIKKGKAAWLRVLRRFKNFGSVDDSVTSARLSAFYGMTADAFSGLNRGCGAIAWLDDGQPVSEADADLLALETFFGKPGRILWQRAPSGLRNFDRYCLSSPSFHSVWPDPAPPLPVGNDLFQGECQFSRFACTALSSHGAHPGSYIPTPWLSIGQILRPMLECALLNQPWLVPAGFSDLGLFDLPHLPAGVTRDCRVSAGSIMWLEQDRAISRMCRTNLSMREIAANGRRTDVWRPLCTAMCVLAGNPCPVIPIWDKPFRLGSSDASFLADFYAAENFGAEWHFVSDFVFPNKSENSVPPVYGLAITPFAKCAIDCGRDYGYNSFLYLMECLFQGAMLALARENSPGASTSAMAGVLAKWRCSGIGFIRFDASAPLAAADWACLRQSWKDEKLIRFDAQVWAGDKALLTLHQLEFDRAPAS